VSWFFRKNLPVKRLGLTKTSCLVML
jgi:hypothetical protein